VATLVSVVGSATAQTPDWTLDVPLQLSSLDPQVRHVVVMCFVGPDAFSENGSHYQRQWIGTAGGPLAEVDGFPTPPGAAGVAIVAPDASGSVQTQLSVPVFAPPGMTIAQKLAATNWACGIALSVNAEAMYRESPDPNSEYSWAQPAPGASFTPVVSGTFN
jgi:hypothetical protein